LPIQLSRFISKLADALLKAGQLVRSTTLSEIRGSHLHAFHCLHELRSPPRHVVEALPHLDLIGTTMGEVPQGAHEVQVVGTQRLNSVGDLSEQRVAIDAIAGRCSACAAGTTATQMGVASAARAVLGQSLHCGSELLRVFQNVAPSAEQPMARSSGLDDIEEQVHSVDSDIELARMVPRNPMIQPQTTARLL
jgi:hypothetical protein